MDSLKSALRSLEQVGWKAPKDISVGVFPNIPALKRVPISAPPDITVTIDPKILWCVVVESSPKLASLALQRAINDVCSPINREGHGVGAPVASGFGIDATGVAVATAIRGAGATWSLIYTAEERFPTRDEVELILVGETENVQLIPIGAEPVNLIQQSKAEAEKVLALLSARIDSDILLEFRSVVGQRHNGHYRDHIREEIEMALRNRTQSLKRELGLPVEVKSVEWRKTA